MKPPFLLLVLFFVMVCMAAYGQPTLVADRLVFGTYYGRCAGKCVNVYQLDNAALHKDDSATYSSLSWTYYFNATSVLGKDKFNIAKSLLNEIPAELFSKGNKTYGCPDCTDQGGMYVEIILGPADVRFKIDPRTTDDQSPALLAFKQRVMAVVKQLQ